MNVRNLALEIKINLLERAMTAAAIDNGPYTGMQIVIDAILKYINTKTAIAHASINVETAKALEEANITVDDINALTAKRSKNRKLLQKTFSYFTRINLPFEQAQRHLRRLVTRGHADFLNGKQMEELKNAGIIEELDLNYVLTPNRMNAVQILLEQTSCNGEQAFAHIDGLNGVDISALPRKISQLIADLSNEILSLAVATGEGDIDKLIENIKAQIAAGKINLQITYVDLVLTYKLKAKIIDDIKHTLLGVAMNKTMESYFKTTLSQSYSVAQSITQTFSSWVTCLTENYCPRIIPRPFTSLSAPKDDINALVASPQAKNNRDAVLITMAQTLVENYHLNMPEIVADMIEMSEGGKTIFTNVNQYETAFKDLKVNADYIRNLFSDSLVNEIISVNQARTIEGLTQNILSGLMTYLILQPEAERVATLSKVSTWIGCYLQNNCVAGLLDGSYLWNIVAAESAAPQIEASTPTYPVMSSHMTTVYDHIEHPQADVDVNKQLWISAGIFTLMMLPIAKMAYECLKHRFFKPAPVQAAKEPQLTSIAIKNHPC